jgi:hypothetical protein
MFCAVLGPCEADVQNKSGGGGVAKEVHRRHRIAAQR